MTIASEPRGRGIQVTIKYGKGYEETWVSFAGLRHEVREDIIAYFDFDESANELTDNELISNAQQAAHAVGTIGNTFPGARAIPSSGKAFKPAHVTTIDDPWAGVDATQSAPSEPTPPPVLQLIESAESVDALKRVWAENQSAFADPAVSDAYKAKGRALKEAGK